jgi:hypothetical protein
VRLRLGLCCLCAAAIAVLLAPSGSAAPLARAAPQPAVASITTTVNSWIRGALCRVWKAYCDGPWYCQVSTRLPAKCQPADIWGALFYGRWILYVSLGLAALFLFAFGMELRGFRADPDDPLKMRSGQTDFRLHYSYGEVTNVERETSTVIWSSGSGSGSNVSHRWYATVVGRDGSVNVEETGNMPVNIGYDLYSFWAIEDGKSAGPFILQVNCFNNAVWTYPVLITFVRVTWEPMLLLGVLQGLLFRWFSIFTIPLTVLLYAGFQQTATDKRKDDFMKHLYQTILPRAVPSWSRSRSSGRSSST